ncbi:MAG: FkbM family methyltransferase [candidate division NC10 bacterium]|nr:FkbM family methyltransferase [candidate division NC10 bacterium]MBI2457947.1 FkbM family methyltransferase [candidate division NC10 bacterium]MBI3086694.1 FkbM family methyltransferase [candidate division NC10 bacterium]
MASGSEHDEHFWMSRRARWFNQAVQISDFPAQTLKALEPVLVGCRSVLDVGAGVGALTLPLARSVEAVTAMEPSPAMLEALRENLAHAHLRNVTCIPAAWGKTDVPPHDLILVANVSPIFTDLLGFLTTAEPLARRAIALVQNVGPGTEKFYFGELHPLLLGRPYPGRDDYLKTVTLLHSLGIYADVQIISYHFDQPFADIGEAVDFWKEQMRLADPEQERRLVGYLQTKLQRVGSRLVAPMRRQSAVLTWRVAPRDRT